MAKNNAVKSSQATVDGAAIAGSDGGAGAEVYCRSCKKYFPAGEHTHAVAPGKFVAGPVHPGKFSLHDPDNSGPPIVGAVPTSAPARFELIDLAKLEESPFNPRKHFDAAKLEELAESVRAKGVLEPLLVRPAGKGYQVVAGARRFRAAQKAILEQVPCLVRELSDVEALEIAIIENVQRDDITAMDEGDAYRELLKLGRTVEELVEKTGRSRTIVFARMKLAELQGEARELVLTGKWSASIGELIARLPTPKAQEAAMKRLQEKQKYSIDGVAGISFRAAKEILDDEFELQLKSASFDVKDEQLLAGAGACGTCLKRTAAPDNREAFKDVKVDTCLDEQCWNKKKAASYALLKAELAANGKTLVKEKNLVNTGYYGEKGFTAAAKEKYSKPADEVLGEKTWKDLLGEEVPKVVVLDGQNKTHNLVDRKKALALLKEKDPKTAEKLEKAATEPKKADWEVQRAKDEKKREAEIAAQRVVRARALVSVTKLEAAVGLLIVRLAARAWNWSQAVEAAGLPKGTKAEKLTPAQRVAIVVGQALAEGDAYAQAAKLVKLDVKALTKKALAAEPGTCFACGCTKEKQCRKNGVLCVDAWVDAPEGTLCTACGGDAGKKPGED